MENSEIIDRLKLTADLLDVHDENVFKAQSYRGAAWRLEKSQQPLKDLDLEQLQGLDGVGKSIAEVIHDLNTTGEFETLNKLLEETPPGVVEFLDLSGIGPKKIGRLWRALGVETIPNLKKACEQGRVADLKGFGEKVQANILAAIEQKASNEDKFHLDKAEQLIVPLESRLKGHFGGDWASVAGEWRRKVEVITSADFVIGTDRPFEAHEELGTWPELIQDSKSSSPFCFRGRFVEADLPVRIWLVPKKSYGCQLAKHTGSQKHLASEVNNGTNLFQIMAGNPYVGEDQLYEMAGLPWIVPEMREAMGEFTLSSTPKLLEYRDLRGVIHAHSTYSDGKNTLREMAQKCRDLGLEYLGITDHSVSAVYANGLDETRINQQHDEIDKLNQELAPFRIFKGIEADILAEGKLDYEDRVLEKFEFIIASIHSQTNMDQEKATRRVLNAIDNPFTTIMGHLTGRLLLRRPGFPLDMKKVIQACAENKVAIEINAHPYRLDLDWRWVGYAIDQGVKISINPDSHQTETFEMMKYGVYMGRKGGLTAADTLNTLSADQLDQFFRNRKAKILN